MSQDDPVRGDKSNSALARVLRFDSVIAVSALLISSLTAGGSWWQTRIIQEQLSAQVWPYVSVSEDYSNGSAVSISVANDGLGPAVLESESLSIDGKPQRNFIQAMHTVLGPNIVARRPPHEKMSLSISSGAPGSVLRPGESNIIFALSSKHFAPLFLRAFSRIDISVCYCAILPNTCWFQNNSESRSKPQAVRECDEVRNDLLHVSAADEMNTKY